MKAQRSEFLEILKQMMDGFFDQSESSTTHIGDQAPAFQSVTNPLFIHFHCQF